MDSDRTNLYTILSLIVCDHFIHYRLLFSSLFFFLTNDYALYQFLQWNYWISTFLLCGDCLASTSEMFLLVSIFIQFGSDQSSNWKFISSYICSTCWSEKNMRQIWLWLWPCFCFVQILCTQVQSFIQCPLMTDGYIKLFVNLVNR